MVKEANDLAKEVFGMFRTEYDEIFGTEYGLTKEDDYATEEEVEAFWKGVEEYINERNL